MRTTIYFLALVTAFSAALSQFPTYHSVTSTKGNIEVTVTNDGRIGYNPNLNESGFVWPRGSNAQYLYGGGFILLRLIPTPGPLFYLAQYSYNFNDATSWYVPGAIADGDALVPNLASKYKVYNSLDYDKYTGVDLNDETNPRWPIWQADDYLSSYYGDYKVNESERTRTFSKPIFKSDEDIVAIYKNTDTTANKSSFIFGGGLPLGIEAETRVYSYGNESQKNMVFINWIITNTNDEGIGEVSFAPVFDIDITKKTNAFSGIDNDIIIYSKDSSYVTFATEMEEYEVGEEFGYISFKWVQLPYIKNYSTIDYSSVDNQNLTALGYRELSNDNDYFDFEHSFVHKGELIGTNTEQKFIMPTNSFRMLANQSASFVLQINMTPPNEGYPEMDEETRKKIEAELEANEIFFKERLTSVEVAEELTPISVFPNPTVDGNINIELGLPIGEQMTIELFDLTGNSLGTLYQGMHHSQNYDLKIGKRTSGTYLLRFNIGDKSFSKKFVVGG